ncbi:hypothetical protein [Streptomyces sp. NPDC002132]
MGRDVLAATNLIPGHRRDAIVAAVDPDQPGELQPSGRSNAYGDA